MNLSQFRHILVTLFLLPTVALLIVAGILFWQIRAASNAVENTQTADRNLQRVGQVQKLILDQETGLRGYQLTHDSRFLEPFNGRQDEIIARFTEIESNVRDYPQQVILTRNIRGNYLRWLSDFAQPQLALIRAGKSESDPAINIRGKLQMDDIRDHLGALLAAAGQDRDRSIAAWRMQLERTRIYTLVLAILAGLLIAYFTYRQFRRVFAIFSASLDTAQTRAEDLFRSEQRLRATLVSIGDAVIVTDASGCVTMLNPIAVQLTGWSNEDASGQPIGEVFNIINEQTREPVEDPVTKVKRLDRIVGLANHTVLIRRDGEEILIDDSGAPIRDSSGKLTGVVMVFRDVTNERRTQKALLASERLAVAGRLAATIAHEIHNPLDSVSNILYLLRNSPNTDEERDSLLETADQELSRVTQISRSMLSLYRESRSPVPVELSELLEDLLRLMEHNLVRSRIQLEKSFPSTVTIEGYPAELRQVFTNLITNASEAAGDGGLLRLELTPAINGAEVAITNSGPAVPAETQAKLFQPFFSTKGEKGTGLGLWVSRGIISKHGGNIRLDSPVLPDNTGVRVTVTLPAHFTQPADAHA